MEKDLLKKFPNDKERLKNYIEFIHKYNIQKIDTFIKMYDITELESVMPKNPTDNEKLVFNALIGVEGNAVYLDYYRSNNTFELLMQFQESTTLFDEKVVRLNNQN